MRIVITSNDFRVYWKGRLHFLKSYLAAHKIDLHIVELFGKGSPYAFDAFDNGNKDWWHCLFPSKRADELTTQQIKDGFFSALDALNPEIVIASPITFFAGAFGLRWSKKNKKKYVMFDDAKPLQQFKRNPVVTWVRNLLTSQADALWLPTDDYNDAYPAVDRKKTLFFYGYSCINNDFFKSQQPKRSDNNIILCVARLVPVKNIANLLKAWEIVELQNKTYQLQIVGDGPLANELKALKKELNLKNVAFSGAISYNQITTCYLNADALVLPSLSETWGLVVNEAMASGLPIVLSNKVNAAQSLLKENVNGFSFDPCDTKKMASALLKFMAKDASEKQAMSSSSLAIINDLNYENMGMQLVNALQTINGKKFRKPSITASAITKRWNGKHDTSAWNTL